MRASNISIIIPVGPHDLSWQRLAAMLPSNFEVVWSIGEIPNQEFRESLAQYRDCSRDLIVSSATGRASQLNHGAEVSTKETLWFLHSDSELFEESVKAVISIASEERQAIWYFDLVFTDGVLAMKLNEWGVWLRSRLIKLPFGDQGFVLSRSLFFELGGFPSIRIGEDLVFVRMAARQKVSINPLHARLGTSARKYRAKWLKTTCLHLCWTVRLMKYADSSVSRVPLN